MRETQATTEANAPPSGCLTPHHVWTKGCQRCEHRPPPQVYDAIIESLRHATIDDLCEDDGNAYPLIDMLSDDGGTVASGIARAEQIACDTAFDIWPTVKAYAAESAAAKDAEITKLTSQLDEARAQIAALSDPVIVHANMLRGTIAKPSLTNFLHAMGNHALVAIRETVAIAERNEKSKYVERARHLLNIDGDPPENLVEEARAKAIEESAQVAVNFATRSFDPEHAHPRVEVRFFQRDAAFEIEKNIRALIAGRTK